MPKIEAKVVGPHTAPTMADLATERDAARKAGLTANRTDHVARNQEGLVNAGHKLGSIQPDKPRDKRGTSSYTAETKPYKTPGRVKG